MSSLAAKRKSPDDDAFHHDTVTPTNSPPKKKLRLTRNQKQALIDNLQLEITERARKLRAQYALQTNDLRSRIERRINRIPVPLRKANMGELLEKHAAAVREGASPRKLISPGKGSRNLGVTSSPGKKKLSTASPNARRTKKQSHEGIYSDKENAPTTGDQLDVLNNPKRRGKAAPATGTSRVVSQEVRGADYRILSPKSSNSRTYPQSPLRASPEKSQNTSYLSRPVMSPLKPSSPLKSAAAGTRAAPSSASGRPTSQAGRRPASRAGAVSKTMTRSPLPPRPATRQVDRRDSVSSSASSGTTVAKPTRTGTGTRKATTTSTASAPTKKTTVARNTPQAASAAAAKKSTATATTGRKATTVSTTASEAPGTKQRALRKRA